MTLPAARDSGTDLFFKLAFAVGVMVALLELGYLLSSPLPYDPVGYMVGRDFVNTWLGAKLALTGNPAPFFGPDAYRHLLADNFGANYPLHIWSYPPHFLLFTWPWGLLPYMPAYILYSVLGLILYVWVVSDGERRPDHLVLLVIAPAVTLNIWTGQNGFLTTAMLVGGLIQLDRRPILAGVLFGMLTIKPQLGVVLPLMLLLTGRWRTIGAAAVTVAVLAAITTIAFGPHVWTAYVDDALPTQRKVVFGDFSHYMVHMPTAFMNAKVAGLSTEAAGWIQAVVIGADDCRGHVDILAAARPRSLQRASDHRGIHRDALCLQLRHGAVQLGHDHADGPQRQQPLGLLDHAGRLGGAVPDRADGHLGDPADIVPADLRFRHPADLAAVEEPKPRVER